MFANQLTERAVGEWTVSDDALVLTMVDDFPAFGGGLVASVFAENGPQAVSAPEIATKERRELERIPIGHERVTFEGWFGSLSIYWTKMRRWDKGSPLWRSACVVMIDIVGETAPFPALSNRCMNGEL